VGGISSVFVSIAVNLINLNISNVPLSELRFLDVEQKKSMRSILGMVIGSSEFFEAVSRVQEMKILE
jgi:hypothetical protein